MVNGPFFGMVRFAVKIKNGKRFCSGKAVHGLVFGALRFGSKLKSENVTFIYKGTAQLFDTTDICLYF